MKTIGLFALTLTLFSMTASAQVRAHKHGASTKEQTVAVHRVVMQLSSADTLEHKGLMNNLKHLKEGWGDSVQVEVVVHGPGIALVTKGSSTQGEAIQQMIQKGVRFVVCRNTMKQRGITEEQILPGVGVVPMGIGEIIKKQEQGWTYIKAGF